MFTRLSAFRKGCCLKFYDLWEPALFDERIVKLRLCVLKAGNVNNNTFLIQQVLINEIRYGISVSAVVING